MGQVEAWARIEGWLASNAPEISVWLNPPATLEAIAATEDLVGARFPDDVREAYLLHDGQPDDSPWLMYGWQWLSMEYIRGEWQTWKDLLDDGVFGEENWGEGDGDIVRENSWNPGWVPITSDGGGYNHCVDLAPGPRGTPGQVIEMRHDDFARPLLATSFSVWVARFADALEAGQFVLHGDNKCLLDRNYL